MPEVAHLLGLELEEEFRFKSKLISLSVYKFKFTEDYLMYYYTEGDYWEKASFETLCNLLNGNYEVVKQPILDDVERKYLASVIRPFRDKIKYFYKYPCGVNADHEMIAAICTGYGFLEFPAFEKGTMYKNMEAGMEYSLESLGL